MQPLSNPIANNPKLTRPSCLRRRSILDKLSLEDFAPVRSRSTPGSAGAKSSDSDVDCTVFGVVGEPDLDTFGVPVKAL